MASRELIVIGAGAAGLMAGLAAARRGRKVLVLDHMADPGEKIRISGGGRCNFTNLNATVKAGRERFLSQNSRFAFSALSRFTPADFIGMVEARGIAYHEKALGQLFCDGSATQIVTMLVDALREAGGQLQLSTAIEAIEKTETGFRIATTGGTMETEKLVIATGGKSIPKMGASNFAYRIAEQFGLAVTETRPALVPLTFEPGALARLAPLSGVSLDAQVSHGRTRFREALLFTHRGLSGPAILQISSYWREGDAIAIDLLPETDVVTRLKAARSETPKLALQTVLSGLLPRRLAQMIAEEIGLAGMIGDFSDKKLATVAGRLSDWLLKPVGSEGYRTAEVTLGGIDTDGLDARTLEAKTVPGLYFVGEAVDVTGWLGGYNFQWAWASGWAAGQAV